MWEKGITISKCRKIAYFKRFSRHIYTFHMTFWDESFQWKQMFSHKEKALIREPSFDLITTLILTI